MFYKVKPYSTVTIRLEQISLPCKIHVMINKSDLDLPRVIGVNTDIYIAVIIKFPKMTHTITKGKSQRSTEKKKIKKEKKKKVTMSGIEPVTFHLQSRRSTTELQKLLPNRAAFWGLSTESG